MAKVYFKILFLWVFCNLSVYSQSNQYLHFDGLNDFVEVENASQFISGGAGISMTGWFKSDDLNYGRALLSFRGGGSGVGEMYLIRLSNGVIEARFISTSGFHEVVAPAGTMQTGIWQHIAWVYTGSQIQLYVDGTLIGQNSASGTFTSVNRPLTIGRSLLTGLDFYFKGGIDEVTLWSKGLTSADINSIIENELSGTEDNLELYYKFNQGIPAGNNTSISALISEVTGSNDRNGILKNFALQGETSNFVGELEPGFQSITFYEISSKLISSEPFEISAEASSGLPVSFEVVDGPATLEGNVVTVTGVPGEVIIKASQEGDELFDPASPIIQTFSVIDPIEIVPEIDIRHPINGELLISSLGYVQLAAICQIEYTDLLNIDKVEFEIDGKVISTIDHGNNHYTGWWLPETMDDQIITVKAYNNFGAYAENDFEVQLNSVSSDQTVNASTNVWLNSNTHVMEVEAELPSYFDSYYQLIGKLSISCPPGGCDPWDRVSKIEVKGHDGKWYEIIRYLTPYGVACNHEIDLTDFMVLLRGKVKFRFTLETFGNGFYYTLNLEYKAGEPEYLYSRINKLWNNTYPFGDYANLQPTEEYLINFHSQTEASKLKLVSTGHGWGSNNTGNAAEFYETTHQIRVNNVTAFFQHNWNVCNPNPDGCSPQFGTWIHNRAGWCPGAIAPWFSFDLSNYISTNETSLRYVFNPNYVDLCHPNHPNCVTGVTCSNCNDGFNPHLIVASHLIEFSNSHPLDDNILQTENFDVKVGQSVLVIPNPGRDFITLKFDDYTHKKVSIIDALGREIDRFNVDGSSNLVVDINRYKAGIYFVKVTFADGETNTSKFTVIK